MSDPPHIFKEIPGPADFEPPGDDTQDGDTGEDDGSVRAHKWLHRDRHEE